MADSIDWLHASVESARKKVEVPEGVAALAAKQIGDSMRFKSLSKSELTLSASELLQGMRNARSRSQGEQ